MTCTRLFGFVHLRRQHHVNGNYCDILAATKNKKLVIIELKNTEDRYVVQQLTRYYHELIQEKPYQNSVDYDKPVELIVIAPNFHRDNLVDIIYNELKFTLFEFSILGQDDLLFRIKQADLDNIKTLKVPFTLTDNGNEEIDIPPVPRTLNTALARWPEIDSPLVLLARDKILKFDPRIKEIKLGAGDFIYGKGKSKPCAQIFLKKKTYSGKTKHVFNFGLWLPVALGSYNVRSRVTRVIISGLLNSANTIEANSEDQLVNCGLFQRGIGRTQQTTNFWPGDQYLWRFLWTELKESILVENLESQIEKYCDMKGYPNPMQGRAEYFLFFLEIALDTWKQKFS